MRGAAATGRAGRVLCEGKVATIVGTSGDDVLRGTPRGDVIVAGAGNDRIYGMGGNDLICAGPGADFVDGGGGVDSVFGGGGADVCVGVEHRVGCGRDRSAPRLLAASVSGDHVTLRFDEWVELPQPFAAGGLVAVNGEGDDVGTARIVGKTVELTLARSVLSDDEVDVSWPFGAFWDLSGNAVAARPPAAVSNETPAIGCDLSTVPVNGLVAGSGVYPGAPATGLYQHSVGALHALMLFVDFGDAPGNVPPSLLYHGFADPEQSWYSQVSYGKLAVTVTPLLQWVRMAKPSTAYGLSRANDTGQELAYVREAIADADPLVDFHGVDIVYVVASPNSAITTAPSLFGNVAIASPDGVPIYAATSEPGSLVTNRGTDYTFAHETGHMLGLPDLYDYDPAALFPQYLGFTGYWDLMGEIAHARGLLAWQRWELGWLDPTQIRCLAPGRTLTATLAPLETVGGTKMLVARTGPSTALVVENRQRLGEDAGLCNTGALIYTIDNATRSGAGPIRILPAHDDSGVDLNRCGPLARAPLDPGERWVDPSGTITLTVGSAAADGLLQVQATRSG